MLVANAREEARLVEALKNQQVENRYIAYNIFPQLHEIARWMALAARRNILLYNLYESYIIILD